MDFDIKWYELDEKLELDGRDIDTGKGKSFVCGLRVEEGSRYRVRFRAKIDASELAQVPMTVYAEDADVLWN